MINALRVVKQNSFTAWLIVGISAAFYSYDVLLRIAPSVMKQHLVYHYGISSAQLSGITSVYFLIYAPMQMPVGVLMDRYGPKLLLSVSGLICAIGIGLFASTQSVSIAVLSRFLVGLGSSFAFVGVLKLASIMLPPNRFAFVSGATMALGMLGATLGDHLIANLLAIESWQLICFQAAILGLVLTVSMLFMIPKNTNGQPDERFTSYYTIWNSMMRLMKNPQIWLVAMVGCLSYTPLTLFAEHFGIEFLQVKYQLTHIQASSVNAMVFLGWMIGGPLVCSLSDYLKSRRMPIMYGLTISFLCCLAVLYGDYSMTMLSLVMVVYGIANSVQVIVFPIAREIGGESATATAIAMINMICMLSGLMQGLIGYLLDYTHSVLLRSNWTGDLMLVSYKVAYLPLPLFLLIALLFSWMMNETYSSENAANS